MNSQNGLEIIKQKLTMKVKELPKVPGIYKFKNEVGKIIYIGKAKNLKNRVSSYFNLSLDPNSKTYSLVQRIHDIEYIEARSEFDAIILEAALIKKLKPKYNIVLKDDKSHLYIIIRYDEFDINEKKVKIKKVISERQTDIKSKDEVFGPFIDSTTTKYVLKTIRKVVPFRDCGVSKFNKYKKLKSPCLYGHIGLCAKPCVFVQPEQIKKYNESLLSVKRILKGDSSIVKKELKLKMQESSKILDYEEARKYRDLLNKFTYITGEFSTPDDYIENPYLVEDIRTNSLVEIQKLIPFLHKIPERIECYDISNISGTDAVASMVVSTNGKIDKSEYKRFKIKLKNTPDDFGMMQEVIRRRLEHEINQNKKNTWPSPDLILLDGGKGQISSVLSVLKDLNVNIPVVGLAKQFETLVYKENDLFYEKRLDKYNLGSLHLIQLRDEAHRFAQKYHHYLRLKKISEN